MADEEEKPAETRHPVDIHKIAAGHLMAFEYYGIVTRAPRNPQLPTVSLRGVDAAVPAFDVTGVPLIAGGMSADYWAVEELVTMTRLAEQLVRSTNRPLTVVFVKANGEPRTLRGRLVSAEPLLGRSYCEDLDIAHDDKKGRLRLVDHRTLRSLIVGGARYHTKEGKT